MKYLNYGLILVVSLMILIGVTKEFILKYFPTTTKLLKTYTLKLFTSLSQQTNRLLKNPSYSY